MANPKLKPNQFLLPCGAMITERPILFSTDMVKANLEDRKTQTRRTKGLESKNEFPNNWHRDGNPMRNHCRFWDSTQEINPNPLEINFGFKIKGWRQWDDIAYMRSIYGKPGDLIWVRETFAEEEEWDELESNIEYLYRADYNDPLVSYSPSIHMPKVASRIWVMIEEIRVERLQDISEEDAIAEGIEPIDQHGEKVWKRYDGYYTVTSKPLVSFWSLWASINGEDSWLSNPWVWVVKYRILSKTGKPSIETIEKNYLEITGKEVSNV